MTLKDLLVQHGKPLALQRGQYLFRQGEADQSIYSLRSGLLKAYYLSEDGRESIKSFILPGDTIGSLKGFFGDNGCSFNLVCLEPSELIKIDFDFLYQHSRSDLGLANEMTDFLLAYGIKKETREFELLCLPAEERYRRLLDAAPSLF